MVFQDQRVTWILLCYFFKMFLHLLIFSLIYLGVCCSPTNSQPCCRIHSTWILPLAVSIHCTIQNVTKRSEPPNATPFNRRIRGRKAEFLFITHIFIVIVILLVLSSFVQWEWWGCLQLWHSLQILTHSRHLSIMCNEPVSVNYASYPFFFLFLFIFIFIF